MTKNDRKALTQFSGCIAAGVFITLVAAWRLEVAIGWLAYSQCINWHLTKNLSRKS